MQSGEAAGFFKLIIVPGKWLWILETGYRVKRIPINQRALRAKLASVPHAGLVRANEEFAKWLRGEKTMPFGKNNHHVPIWLLDFN